MKTPSSLVRQNSPFKTPPRVRVVSDREHITEAVALAESLDECGAEADVRFQDDAADYDHVHPDAYVVDRVQPPFEREKGSVVVAVSNQDDREDRSADSDLVIRRPVEAKVLMRKLGEFMAGRVVE